MRPVVIVAAVALLTAAASSFAAPDRSSRFVGWRYGPISGSATLTATSARLVCSGHDRNERRVISGAYKLSFTGRSMRRTRAAADFGYNLAAGGPAGNTEPIAMRLRRSSEETVQIRTITFDDEGNEICTLTERPCTSNETKELRSAANRLNVMMVRARVRIYPPNALRFGTCAPGLAEPNSVWPVAVFGRFFPLALFNRPRARFRFAWSGRVRSETETGVPVTGALTYNASIAVVRMPGTPPARCRVC
jgi:hypothetical protein